jgi:hypothetical protein
MHALKKPRLVEQPLGEEPPKFELTMSIGPAIDKLNEIRERKRKWLEKVAACEVEYDELEQALLGKLDADGIEKATGRDASVSVSMSVVGNTTDWDALNAFIHKHKYYHFYQRRLSDPALRELWDAGKKIPGVEAFTKRRLNLRTTKGS